MSVNNILQNTGELAYRGAVRQTRVVLETLHDSGFVLDVYAVVVVVGRDV